jgi:hypothetical protein
MDFFLVQQKWIYLYLRWKEIVGIRRGFGLGSWFDDNLVRVVGDGAKIIFLLVG